MATFGTGPFSSDGALDLLDEMAARPPDERAGALDHMLARVLANPDELWQGFFPDEIVAAAALVVATLPGGEYLHDGEFAGHREAQAAALPGAVPELAVSARGALLTVAGPAGAWLQGWKDEETQAGAQETVDRLFTVLDAVIG